MSQSLTVELLLFPQFVFLFCDIFLGTLLKKLKEHIESTSNLNGEKNHAGCLHWYGYTG